MPDPATLVILTATFLIAGTVKGVIGVGLPTIAVGLLAAVLDLPTAMTLLVAPAFLANVWQAGVGGHGRAVFRRIWPFLLMATATVWIGAHFFTRLDLALLSALLGVLLVAYAGVNLAGIRLTVSPGSERWAGPVFGAVNGILTGLTGSFVVPGVMFLQAIGLGRDALIQAMGMLFLASTVALALTLRQNGLLTAASGALSLAAVVPAFIGIYFGQRIRRRLSETAFRKVFFVALLVLGLYIVAEAIVT